MNDLLNLKVYLKQAVTFSDRTTFCGKKSYGMKLTLLHFKKLGCREVNIQIGG